MSARTGLPEVEVAVLAGIGTAVARAGGPVITEQVLAELDGVIGATAAYRLLFDLVAPWRRHLPLVRGGGNWGSSWSVSPGLLPRHRVCHHVTGFDPTSPGLHGL